MDGKLYSSSAVIDGYNYYCCITLIIIIYTHFSSSVFQGHQPNGSCGVHEDTHECVHLHGLQRCVCE